MGNTRLLKGLALAALALLLVVPSTFAQTTNGSIVGTVTDQSGAPLPGVQVSVSSPNLLGGAKTAATDKNGEFRVVQLPPGNYTVKFRLDQFQDLDQEGVRVNIAQATPLQVQMTSQFTEEIKVTSETPVVNTTTTESGVNLTSDFFTKLPTGRGYTSVARVTPGAQTDASGTTFYGSTGAENAYYIDGVNTTGVELGQQGKTLNFEFVEEVQVKTAGYNAEYGRNTGGIINVITKSGGNEFHGDVFGYYDSDSLQANLKGEAQAGAVTGSFTNTGNTREDFGVDLGGYFVKDKLWFFGAFDRVDNSIDRETTDDFTLAGGPPKGAQFKVKTTRNLFAGKLTWLVNPRHTVSASAFGDPSKQEGPVLGSLTGPATHYDGSIDTGATDYVVNYDGVFTDSLVITGRYASHNEKSEISGPGKNLVGFIDDSDPLGDGTVVWGWPGAPSQSGVGFFQDQKFGRDTYRADASYFVNNFGGDHEFKFGLEYEKVSVNNANNNSGGQRIYRFCCRSGKYYYRHRYFVATKIADTTKATLADINNPLVVDTKAEDEAYFLQDTWRAASNLTFDIGVRWDIQKLYNGNQEVQQKLDDAVAPRVGFIWDPMKNGRSKIYAHYGLFYETIPMDIVIRSYGGEISIFAYNFSDNPNDVAHDPATGLSSRTLGGGFSRVDPNTKSQHIQEIVVGAEYEVIPNLAVGIKYVSRDLKNIMEDALSADGDYFIGNPGKGLMTGTYDIGYAFGYNDVLHHLNVPTRKFKGVELTVTKRPTKNFQFISSLLWSKLDGTYDGLYQASTGQLDPNLNSAFDYYDFSVNNTGKLSNDRTWQFKWDGTYQFNFGLTLGLSTYWQSGVPITAYGYSYAYANWEYYLSTRGAFGRTDNEYEANIHLGYPIKLGNGMEINLLADVFNLFNRQGQTGRDMRYTNAQEKFFTSGYVPIDWFTGQSFPPLNPSNPRVPPTNSGWNTSNAWTGPLTTRLGVRLSW